MAGGEAGRAAAVAGVVLASWCAALLAGAADAATFQRTDIPDTKTPGILLSGVIRPGDQATFHALAETMPDAIVVTTGPGGSVGAALAIGTEIRERGWATLVPPGASCASACSLIWLAGARRMLADDGRIGFHAMSISRDGYVHETHQADIDLHRWLTGLGYSEDTTATIVNTPSALVRWLDRIELQANGIETDPYP